MDFKFPLSPKDSGDNGFLKEKNSREITTVTNATAVSQIFLPLF